MTPGKRKSAPAKARSARAASASAAAKPSKAARSSAVSALAKPRRSFDTRVIGIGVVCVLIVITLGAARRHPPTEAEIAKMVDSAMKDPNTHIVTVPDDDAELAAAEPVRTPASPRAKPAVESPTLKLPPLVRASATTPSARPEPSEIESKTLVVPAAAVAPAPPAQASASASVAAATQTASMVTLAGCLEESGDGFVLKDATGDAAPKSRSWKSGFIKKRTASVGLIDEAHLIRASLVGQRIETTGVLEDREMRVRSLRIRGTCD